MRFFAPAWLWGLLALPLVYWMITYDEKKRQNLFSNFINKKLWSMIVPELDTTRRVKKARVLILVFAFTLIALARPQLGTHEESVHTTGLDIVLGLDVSSSMYVEDVVPSRLQKAKHLIRSLLNRLDGDRVGVVAFAGSSYVACPLTTDLSYVWDTVQILGPKVIQNQGTDIGTSLEVSKSALEKGGEELAVAGSSIIPSHVVILISDGEDHEQTAIKAAEKFKENGTKLYILGIGSEPGGPIPLKDANGNSQGFKKDRSGETIVSTFHPQFLQEIAKAAGGKYWNITPGETEIEELIQDLNKLNRGDYEERKYVVYEERFQIPLLIAILLLMLEITLPARKLIRLSVVALLSLETVGGVLGGGFLGGKSAFASDLLKNTPSLNAYLENKKGIDAYKQGDMEAAQKSFGTAQALDPTRPELNFNEGVIEMQKGDYDRAIESFKSAAKGSGKNSSESTSGNSDSLLYGKSLYNLGNALAKKGNNSEAVQTYLEAINSARQTKNKSLEYESRKNLQLLIQEAKKQEQQKKEEEKQKEEKGQEKGQEKGEDKKKEKENQEKDPNKKSQDQDKNKQEENDPNKNKEKNQSQDEKQKGGDQKEETKRYQDTSKDRQTQQAKQQQFRSTKMKPEDAERVMSELTTRERELQEKLQTQNVKPQNNSKDW